MKRSILSLGESFDLGKVKIETVGNLQEGGTIEYCSWVAVGEKDGKIVEQVLSGEENFDDAMYRLIFVADLDGDGIPDIVADLTNHYNVSKKMLFLSSLADEGEWHKKVGDFTAIGC
ncbi:hypothetical protein R9C00_00290 [Flammeovirgaceae bacterium SG7u.111]|nr:hypothetical protein [Flammeovirgaceae bacterium SG7u.132]WPO35892.1 hypothetical protein R9C00_00290 [Flammeovirgaceae bacterium SG7u.111]